jgi:hypothetical protein
MYQELEEVDRKNIIDHLLVIAKKTPNIGIKIVKNYLGFFHITTRNTPDNEFLSPESLVSILTSTN